MIELRLNKDTGKYERPGPDKYGRVYKVVDQMTGKVGYNCTYSDLPGLDPCTVKMIQKYDTFGGWVTPIISYDEMLVEVRRLNAAPAVFEETPHTLLVKRVQYRLAQNTTVVIDGHTVIDDMREMLEDIEGRRVRPALPGWQ